jgi:hypothetical protein
MSARGRPRPSVGSGAFIFDDVAALQLDGLDLGHEAAGIATQERRHDTELPPTKFRPGHLSAPKVDIVWTGSRTVRDAGGSRTHLNRVAAGGRAVWLQRRDFSVLARN